MYNDPFFLDTFNINTINKTSSQKLFFISKPSIIFFMQMRRLVGAEKAEQKRK